MTTLDEKKGSLLARGSRLSAGCGCCDIVVPDPCIGQPFPTGTSFPYNLGGIPFGLNGSGSISVLLDTTQTTWTGALSQVEQAVVVGRIDPARLPRLSFRFEFVPGTVEETTLEPDDFTTGNYYRFGVYCFAKVITAQTILIGGTPSEWNPWAIYRGSSFPLTFPGSTGNEFFAAKEAVLQQIGNFAFFVPETRTWTPNILDFDLSVISATPTSATTGSKTIQTYFTSFGFLTGGPNNSLERIRQEYYTNPATANYDCFSFQYVDLRIVAYAQRNSIFGFEGYMEGTLNYEIETIY